jgi:hypothetical protein
VPTVDAAVNNTANFRATATAARSFAFLPSRVHSCSPYRRKSLSGSERPQDIMRAPYQQPPQHSIPRLADSQLRLSVPGILLLGY